MQLLLVTLLQYTICNPLVPSTMSFLGLCLYHPAPCLHVFLVPLLSASLACRALIEAGHPDAPQALALGKIPHHLMRVSTHLYATHTPKWHSVIQSELIRSLILAGTPQALLGLTPLPSGTHVSPQSNLQVHSKNASHSFQDLEDPGASQSDNRSLLLADGTVNRQAAEAASAQSYPVLLHQALMLAVTADWGPADFGGCETDSSDSSASESSGSVQADDSAAQSDTAAAGHEKVLAIAVMAATHCCDKPTPSEDDSRAKSGSLTHEVSVFIAGAGYCKTDKRMMLTTRVRAVPLYM